MKPVVVVGLAALTLAVGARSGVADPPTPVPAAEQHTTVRGTPPDLGGRWLALAWLDVPGRYTRTNPALWEVTRQGGQLDVALRFADLPAAQQAAVDEANRNRRQWTPSPGDVDAIAAAWDGLLPRARRTLRVETTVIGRDGFDERTTTDAGTADALWIVEQTETADPHAAPTVSQSHVYAAGAPTDGGWTGSYQTVVVAAAPFPIPVTFHGRFQLYRLPPRGLLSRLVDAFAGCGRR